MREGSVLRPHVTLSHQTWFLAPLSAEASFCCHALAVAQLGGELFGARAGFVPPTRQSTSERTSALRAARHSYLWAAAQASALGSNNPGSPSALIVAGKAWHCFVGRDNAAGSLSRLGRHGQYLKTVVQVVLELQLIRATSYRPRETTVFFCQRKGNYAHLANASAANHQQTTSASITLT